MEEEKLAICKWNPAVGLWEPSGVELPAWQTIEFGAPELAQIRHLIVAGYVRDVTCVMAPEAVAAMDLGAKICQIVGRDVREDFVPGFFHPVKHPNSSEVF